MEFITLEELLEKTGYKLGDIANDMHCSISLLSKIKNGGTTLTEETQVKFRNAYPKYYLVGGKEKWKELYLEEVEENKQLKEENEKLKKELNNIKKSIINLANKVERGDL